MTASSAPALLLGVALPCCVIAIATFTLVGPPPAPADAPPATFSAARATAHLEWIAAEPRPVGSAGHARVRAALIDVLRRLGWQVELQEGVQQGEALVNIIARRRGVDSSGAVVIACHYDSARSESEGVPGAADDGAAVAAALETARALDAGPPLANDIVLLFTDGEELGLLGARLLASEPARLEGLEIALNFEARGNSGPSIMFETSDGNAALIDAYARVCRDRVASSLAYAIYRLLPNDTDLTVLKEAGLRGLNFAFVNGWRAYHTGGDTIENLSRRSLQHHGENMLALARHFGGVDLRALAGSTDDAVYFNVAGDVFVRYPMRWSLPLAGGALLVAALAVVALGIARPGRRRDALRALWGHVVLLVEAVVIVALVGATLQAVLPARSHVADVAGAAGHAPRGDVIDGVVTVLGILALTLSVCAGSFARLVRRFGLGAVTASSLALWGAGSALTGTLLPGASYLFAWPLLAGAAGALLATWLDRRRCGSLSSPVVAAVAAFPACLLLGPTAYLMHLALAPGGVPAFVAPAALFVLLSGLLAPCLAWPLGAAPRPGVASAVAAPSLVPSGGPRDDPSQGHGGAGIPATLPPSGGRPTADRGPRGGRRMWVVALALLGLALLVAGAVLARAGM